MHQALRAPAAQAAASSHGLGSALTDLRSTKALVIDTNPTSRSILRGMLADLGVKSDQIKQVGRYHEARSELEGTSYDIVLCDYHFNDTDQTGADLLDELRRSHSLPYATVFIMVTAEATHGKVAEAAESALDSYLLKPHNHHALADRLSAARLRKMVLADIFNALQKEDFKLAADLCLARFAAQKEYWVYAARIGGELLLRQGRHEEARKMFEALNATKAMPWARLGIARAQLEGGQIAPACRTLESLIIDNPSHADAYDVMGRAQLQAGQFDEAYATYQQAVSLTPGCVMRLQKAGMLAFYLGKTEEATRVLEKANALGSSSRQFDFQSLVLLAQIQFKQKDSKGLHKSLAQLQQAHERAPRSVRLRRMYELLHVLSLMLQRQVAEVVRRVKTMSREFSMADFAFEAAGNSLSLLETLRSSELELPDAELWIEKLAQRHCTSKVMTETLCMSVRQHPPYDALVREAYQRIASLSEQCLAQAKSGQASLAIEQMLAHATQSGNVRLLDLADMLLQRYRDELVDMSLGERLQALRKKQGRA